MTSFCEIEGAYAEIDEKLGGLETDLEEKFAEADDVAYGRYIIKQLDRVSEMKSQLLALKNRHDEILDDEGLLSSSGGVESEKSGLRQFFVEVTEGMLKNSLLTLTKPKKQGLVQHGEEMTIHMPFGREFTTEILPIGNRLRERGKIAAFYEHEKVVSGERVLLKETKPGHWRLTVDHQYRARLKEAFGI